MVGNLYLKNARIWLEGRFVDGGVLCLDGKIAMAGSDAYNPGFPVFDCGGMRLVPGFLDLHTHGAVGVDVNAADANGLRKVSAFFASQGTTGWLASVLTDTEEQTLACLSAAAEAMQTENAGARLLGVHLEGPFLAAEYKGAMPETLLREGDRALLDRYRAAAGGVVRYLTVSPEVAGAIELIEQVAETLPVAIGHSGADYETAIAAIDAGARCCTHTCNVMGLLHQHRPGMLGAVIEREVFCEMICDGRHLHPGTVRFLLAAKGLRRTFAVTDSIMAAGLADGHYRLGVNEVVVRDGDATLAENGVRAGSTLTMIGALRNLLTFTGRPLEELIPLVSGNAAEALRIADHKGRIAPGLDADLALLDEQVQVAATFVGGRAVYTASHCV